MTASELDAHILLLGALFDKLDAIAHTLSIVIGSIHKVERIHKGQHDYEIHKVGYLRKGN